MGERIFVVEDDENIREIINLALVSNGYEVVQFDNAIAVSYTHLTLPTNREV